MSRHPPLQAAYHDDLAYIHDAGFGGFARGAAAGLLPLLRQAGIMSGRVIDLGCGSGIWAGALATAGYDVLGIDLSEAMVRMARQRVPQGEFRAESFLTAELPPCAAVTALGECFNYLFDGRNTRAALCGMFRRILDALPPGGLFVFDVAGPGRVPAPGTQRKYTEGEGWAVLVEAEEDRRRRLLTRRITTFRKVGELYRSDHEVHRLRLYPRQELTGRLRRLGFRVRTLAGYGPTRFAPGHVGFCARKP
jgi:SAM-dependent methyltransferase